MLREILFILFIYFLYRFIFGFVVPLFTATKQMQRNIRSMQQDMSQQANRQQQKAGPQQAQQQTVRPEKETPKHEYIDFEEVK